MKTAVSFSWLYKHSHVKNVCLSFVLLGIMMFVSAGLSAQINVRIKLFLQGPYNAALDRHNDVTPNWVTVLQNNAASQPYNMAPFNYTGAESVNTAMFTATAATTDIVDWVLVELKNAGGASVAKRAALVLENGDVVDVDGVSPVAFTAIANNYYITVNHRNHLNLSTEQRIPLTASPALYDFDFTRATDATLYGPSSAFAVRGASTLLVAGDANANSIVRYNGPANDRDVILSYLGYDEAGYIANVYRAEDINLDGVVRYNGPGNDRDALLEALDFNEVGYKQAAQIPVTEIPLPVTWGVITAVYKNGQLIVNWETKSETNNKTFIVQASADGNEWHELGTVASSHSNTSTAQRYEFIASGAKLLMGVSLGGLLLLGFAGTGKKRRSVVAMGLLLMILVTMNYACSKNKDQEMTTTGTKLKFVRIVQVDIDGAKKYSIVTKIIKW